ncbi:MAG: 4-carboxy-4-hydroxy-2-oxoadipate aldolase/oxaloacetate decarboxylase [Candidatus Dormibacteria bacterium]
MSYERSVGRVPSAAVATLASHGVAAAHEAYARAGLLDPALRPIQQGMRLAGRAVTVLCPPADNLMIHMAIEHCHPGDVLVVATVPLRAAGVLGELLATSLRAHGAIAAVIDSGVRDVAALRAMGFPVWSRWISAQGTTKEGPGAVNDAIACAGQVIEPGDIIVADDDGVVRIPAASAVDVAHRVADLAAHEAAIRERLAAGALSADILGLREAAARAGIPSGDR